MVYHLDRKDVPPAMLGAYKGNKIEAESCTSVDIPFDAGLWSSGTRYHYISLDIASGRMFPLAGQDSSPWDENRKARTIDLLPGQAIVCQSVFCGRNMGLTYYMRPDDFAKIVPSDSGVALCDVEKRVLRIIAGYKAFARNDEFRRAGIEAGESDAIKARLIKLGLLNKAGAITISGRNACEGVKL